MSNTFDIRVGSSVSYDGCLCTVIEIAGDAVVLVDGSKKTRRVRLVELLRDAVNAFGLPAEEAVLTPLALIWADATEAQRDEARRKAGHIREMRTGFVSGLPTLALPHEPRPEYDPKLTTIHERRRAKAAELGLSLKTLKRWENRFDEGEELALLDFRKTSWTPALSGLDPRWVDMCRRVVEENVRGARRTVTTTLAIVLARVKREYPDAEVRIPSESTARDAVAELTRGKGTFGASMRAQRSIETRPPVPYGRLVATRPGEYVVLDTTPLNVFGVAPITGKWMRAELTVALDLYDRSILGLRLAPISTKAVDVAGVLMEALAPRELPTEWGDRASWPFHGVPENIVIDVENLKALRFRRPGILPETIIIDHGKPFMSIHVASVCQRLGISIQPAHVYTGTDKAWVERWFRTIDEMLQELPGYKGKDIASRGEAPESEAVYTIPQLEQIIREWIATVYHLRPHGGLVDSQLPAAKMSPAQKFEQGVAMAGRIRVPANPNLLLEMLPVVKRKFNHYGVEIGTLRYNGDIVGKYYDRSRAMAKDKRKWQFSVNPDDFSQIYFNDPDDNSWHVLRWEHAPKVPVPFSFDALEYAKGIALDRRNGVDVSEALGQLLERWGAGRASTPAEKRISARLAAQLAETSEGPDSPFFPHIAKQIAQQVGVPDLSDELGLVSVTPPPVSEEQDRLALSADPLVDDDLDDFDLLEDL